MSENRCFVIGPIGDRLAPPGTPGREKYEQALEVYDQVIAAACAQVGLSPIRADHISSSGEITEQVFRHLYEDEVVIADVSDGNPNVMYELGLRHTRNLLTIQIGEYGQLPFDVSAIRTIQFSRSERGLIDARNRLTTTLQFGLAEGADPVTATKVWLRDQQASPDATPAMLNSTDTGLDIEVEAVEEPEGFLDAMASVETAFPELTAHIENISELLIEMGQVSESAFRDMSSMAEQQGGGTAAQRLTMIKKVANELSGVAERLNLEVQQYADGMDRIDGSVNGVLEYLGAHYTEFDSETDEYLESLASLGSSAREGTEGFAEVVAGLKQMGEMSRVLRGPSRQMTASVERLIAKTRLIDEWEATAIRLRKRVPRPAEDEASESD